MAVCKRIHILVERTPETEPNFPEVLHSHLLSMHCFTWRGKLDLVFLSPVDNTIMDEHPHYGFPVSLDSSGYCRFPVPIMCISLCAYYETLCTLLSGLHPRPIYLRLFGKDVGILSKGMEMQVWIPW